MATKRKLHHHYYTAIIIVIILLLIVTVYANQTQLKNTTLPPEQQKLGNLELASGDLSQFPTLFIKNGTFDAVLVLSQDYPVDSDTIGLMQVWCRIYAQTGCIHPDYVGGVVDTEVTAYDVLDKNLIIVGGPDINRVSALLANVTYPGKICDLYCAPDAATIALYKSPFNPNSTILVINGDANARFDALTILGDYINYQGPSNLLNGKLVTVKHTDIKRGTPLQTVPLQLQCQPPVASGYFSAVAAEANNQK